MSKKQPPDGKYEAEGLEKAHDRTQWRCPACNMPQAKPHEECPQCGVLGQKYLDRKDAVNDEYDAQFGVQSASLSFFLTRHKVKLVWIISSMLFLGAVIVGSGWIQKDIVHRKQVEARKKAEAAERREKEKQRQIKLKKQKAQQKAITKSETKYEYFDNYGKRHKVTLGVLRALNRARSEAASRKREDERRYREEAKRVRREEQRRKDQAYQWYAEEQFRRQEEQRRNNERRREEEQKRQYERFLETSKRRSDCLNECYNSVGTMSSRLYQDCANRCNTMFGHY